MSGTDRDGQFWRAAHAQRDRAHASRDTRQKPGPDSASRDTRPGWRGLLDGIETLHLDRGYDSATARRLCADAGIADVVCPKRRAPGAADGPRPAPLGPRWSIERANSWLSNFGQLRRNTDHRTCHRRAQLALAIACILTAKLIDHRNRWDPTP